VKRHYKPSPQLRRHGFQTAIYARLSFLNTDLVRRFVALSPVLSALGILGLGLMLTGRAKL
jgi:hypothetical protein